MTYSVEQEKSFIEQLRGLVSNKGIARVVKILKCGDYPELLDFIKFKSSFLNDREYKLVTRIYCVINNITEFPVCVVCGKEIHKDVANFYDGFRKNCSSACSSRNPESIEKKKLTNIKKFGVENPFASPEIQAKRDVTMLEKYGVKYSSQSKEIRDKIKKSFKEKYGVECPFESDIIKERARKTIIEKYGVEKINESDEWKESYCSTIKQRRYKSFFGESVEPLFTIDEFDFIRNSSKIYKWKCKECGEVFEDIVNENWYCRGGNRAYARCPKCHPILERTSGGEIELCDFVKSVYSGAVIENDRFALNGKEIDIYLPGLSLGIEFDGIFWHSDGMAGKTDLIDKTVICNDNGIRLIHVFDCEWNNKKDIVKSRIKSIIGVTGRKIFARKCVIKSVPANDVRDFLNNNHLQGFAQSSVNIGLFCDEELVSLMTFGKSRFNKKYQWELVRFCNKLDCYVVGGASKLLKYFEKEYSPESLVSYADLRWSDGNMYKKLGFMFTGNSKPNYWYFKNNKIESRVKYQKYRLSKILDNFDETKTEVENMTLNGYNRIFDCGNMVFTKKY